MVNVDEVGEDEGDRGVEEDQERDGEQADAEQVGCELELRCGDHLVYSQSSMRDLVPGLFN